MKLRHGDLAMELPGGAGTTTVVSGRRTFFSLSRFVCKSVREMERLDDSRDTPSATGGGTNPRKGKVAGAFVGEDWDK